MMKSTTFLLALVVCIIVIQDSAGLWWRWGRPPPPPPSPCYCNIYCTSVKKCHSVCCNRQRSMEQLLLQTRQEAIDKSNAVEVPYPADFSVYDANEDGIITLPEFTDAIRSHLNLDNPEHLTVVFKMGDKNDDGKIDEEELMKAPWKFEEEEEEEEEITDLE